LMFESPDSEIQALKDIVFAEMPNALDGFANLSVPLMVDVKTGLTWGDME